MRLTPNGDLPCSACQRVCAPARSFDSQPARPSTFRVTIGGRRLGRRNASHAEWRLAMFSLPTCLRACALGFFLILLSFTNTSAHCFVGPRFFPATLLIDDPCVADEMSLPTVDWFKTGTSPPGSQWDISAEFDKRITERFGFGITDVW